MLPNLPVFRPQLDAATVWQQLKPVIESGWLGMGPKVAELEQRLARRVKAKHFICTSSCTAALHLAVKCLDLPKGSKVLTTPITFVSTNAALLYCGMVPVWGSLREGQLTNSAHLDASTVATIVVHLGGAQAPYRWDESRPVIEDCAHAFGAPWLGEQKSRMRVWSFHAVKNLPMGDGGGISTNDDQLAERLRRLAWMGISKSTHQRSQGRYVTDYEIPELGFKYHMNDVTAAIGLAALPYVEYQMQRRQEIAARYREAFPLNAPSYRSEDSACHFYPLFFDDRAEIEQRLQQNGIGYSRHYKPNFQYPAFRNCSGIRLDAQFYYERALVLPIFPAMTDQDVERVIRAVKGEPCITAGEAA